MEVSRVFSRRTKARAAGKAASGMGKAAGGAGKVLLKSGMARRAVRATARGAAKGGGKTAGGADKVALKSSTARRAASGAGKAALKGGTRILSPGDSTGARFLKYGLFALAGFAVGALVARLRQEREVSSSFTEGTGPHTADPGSPAGQRGETWGTGTPLGTAGGVSDPAAPQRPEDPSRTGTEREYSDPSSGPLIGRQHQPMVDIPEQQQEVANRIRTRVGEDPRTLHVARLNVEVNDGVTDIRGEVHSEEEKQAVEEIASSIEDVSEVRNLLTVDPNAPSRHDQGGGQG
jgi:BON domain